MIFYMFQSSGGLWFWICAHLGFETRFLIHGVTEGHARVWIDHTLVLLFNIERAAV